jgi:hypothetical protein
MRILLGIATIVFLLAPIPADGQSWVIEDVDAWGRFSDVEIDDAGTIHLVYTNCWWHGLCEDDTNPPRIRYGKKAGTTWTKGLLSSEDAFGIPSITLDSNQRPHVAFQYQSWKNFRYAYHNGTDWVIEDIVPANPTYVKKEISLKLDANDVPHIAFYERERIRYGNRIGGTWSDEPVTDSYLEEHGSLTALVLDDAGNPHIGTKGYTWLGSRRHYKSGGVWITDEIDPTHRGDMTAMVRDATGALHMSFDTNGPSFFPAATYATNKSGSWTVELVRDTARHWTGDIAVDQLGRPYVAYERVEGLYWDPVGLYVAWRTAGGWVHQLVDATGEHPSLAVDPQNRLHVMYFDREDNTLKHAEHDQAVAVEVKSWGEIKALFDGRRR